MTLSLACLAISSDETKVEPPESYLDHTDSQPNNLAKQAVPPSIQRIEPTERPRGCIPIEQLRQCPEAHRLDQWYQSWGAPRSFSDGLASRPYAHFPPSELAALSRNGEPAASHELGRALVWQAFRDGERMPDYQTLWDIGSDPFPYSERWESEQLEQAREYLYQSAVAGRVYALVHIFVSYAHELAVGRRRGTPGDSDERDLRIEMYAYGEAVEELIEGLHQDFFETAVPEDDKDRAATRLSELIVRFTADLTDKGLDASKLPRISDELFDGIDVCDFESSE